MPDPPTAIRFKFTRAPDYRILPANGAWGGLASNGVIAVDFYVERAAFPEATVRYFEGERAGQEDIIAVEPEAGQRLVLRESQIGFMLTPETARAIGKFLMDQADQYERIASGESEPWENDSANSDR